MTYKKADSIIQDLKENCESCKKNVSHNCCISEIIEEWTIIKNGFKNNKQKR